MQLTHVIFFTLLSPVVIASFNVDELLKLVKHLNNTIPRTTLSSVDFFSSPSYLTPNHRHLHPLNTLDIGFISTLYVGDDTFSITTEYNDNLESISDFLPTYKNPIHTESTFLPPDPTITKPAAIISTTTTDDGPSEYSEQLFDYTNPKNIDIATTVPTEPTDSISADIFDIFSNIDQPFIDNPIKSSFLTATTTTPVADVTEPLNNDQISMVDNTLPLPTVREHIKNRETYYPIRSPLDLQLSTTEMLTTADTPAATASIPRVTIGPPESSLDELTSLFIWNDVPISFSIEMSTPQEAIVLSTATKSTFPSVSLSNKLPVEPSTSVAPSLSEVVTMLKSSEPIASVITQKISTTALLSVSSFPHSVSELSVSPLLSSQPLISTLSQQEESTHLTVIFPVPSTTPFPSSNVIVSQITSSKSISSIMVSKPTTTVLTSIFSLPSSVSELNIGSSPSSQTIISTISQQQKSTSLIVTSSTYSTPPYLSSNVAKSSLILSSSESLQDSVIPTKSISAIISESSGLSTLPLLPSSIPASNTVISLGPSVTSKASSVPLSGLSLFDDSTTSSTRLSSTIVSLVSSSKASPVTSKLLPATPMVASSVTSSQQLTSTMLTPVIESTTPIIPKLNSATTTNIVVTSSEVSVINGISTTILIVSTKPASVSATTLDKISETTAPCETVSNVPESSVSVTTTIPGFSIISSPLSSYSTDNPNWWVPTKIITDSEISTVVGGTGIVSETANVPRMITPPEVNLEPAEGYTLINIGFRKQLNYQFVISNPQSSTQIISFLPEVLNNPFNDTLKNVTVVRLTPLQDDSIPYLITVAHCYFPGRLVANLSDMIKTPSSPLYSKKASNDAVNTLVQLIDPSIPITGLVWELDNSNASFGNSSTSNNSNSRSSNKSNNIGNNDRDGGSRFDGSGTLDDSNVGFLQYEGKNSNISDPLSKSSKRTVAGIVVGVVLGSVVYLLAVGFLIKYRINRYKTQNIINSPLNASFSIRSNESSPDLFSSYINDEKPHRNLLSKYNLDEDTLVDEEFGIGIDSKRGKSVRLKISEPITSENSLGF